MKKALVMTFVLVLGLGFAAFADGTLSGVWDTDISLYPAASEFSDFIKSFTSEVDVDYSIGGFVFGVESTFGLPGFTGLDFDIDGALGAFTIGFDIDFSPMVLKEKTIVYDELAYSSSSCIGASHPSWSFEKTVLATTYTAGFDDLTADMSVSIAGVSLEALFYLKGNGNVADVTYGSYLWNIIPYSYTTNNDSNYSQTGSVTVAATTKVGGGWKLTGSGSFGGATLTARVFFNLQDDWGDYNGMMGYYGYTTYVADTFLESGDWALVCGDCISRFTGLTLLLEDVSFGCTSFSAGVEFDCCGFEWAKFLIEDVSLGCCWDLNFDLLITFTPLDKTLSLDPDITIANACFTIDAAVVADTTGDFEIQGIDIYAVGLTYSWNGITFTSDTSFDIAKHPILGSAYYSGVVYSPTKMWVWQPDRHMTEATFTVADDGTCTLDADPDYAVEPNGTGYYVLTGISCEKAEAWEKLVIDVDGDTCCGGLFDLTAAIYMGDVYKLTDLEGWYWYTAAGTHSYVDTPVHFYGDAASAPTEPTYTTAWQAGTDCDCCPCEEGCSFTIDNVDWNKTWGTTDTERLFDWIETDVDVVFGVGSNFDLTFGFDITCWGWEDFTFGFEFTF